MLKRFHIEGYRDLENVDLEFRNLTLLTCCPGASPHQPVELLLMLRQSVQKGTIDSLYDAGSLADVRDVMVVSGDFSARITEQDPLLSGLETVTAFSFKRPKTITKTSKFGCRSTTAPVVLSECLTYLSSVRDNRLMCLDLKDERVGPRGESTRWLLNKNFWEDETIEKFIPLFQAVRETHAPEHSYEGLCLDTLLPGLVNFLLPRSGLNIRYGTDNFTTRSGLPEQYVFPILAACLTARPGSLLIFDLPETALHDRTASRLTSTLAAFAESGLQIIITTHSDSVINGMRLAVKSGVSEKSIVINNLSITDGYAMGNQTITVDKNCRLSAWPEGFFSQIETDLSKL